jgi:hypothetical protein
MPPPLRQQNKKKNALVERCTDYAWRYFATSASSAAAFLSTRAGLGAEARRRVRLIIRLRVSVIEKT